MSGLSKVAMSTKSAAIICPPKECWEQIQDIRSQHDKAYNRWMPHINLLFPFIEDAGDVFSTVTTTLTKSLAHIAPFRVSFTTESFGYFDHGKKCVLWLKPLVATDKSTSPKPKAQRGFQTAAGRKALAATKKPPGLDNLKDAVWTPGDRDENADIFLNETASEARQKQPKPDIASDPHQSILEIENILRLTFPQINKDRKSADGYQPHLTLGQFSRREIDDVIERFCSDWTDITFDVKEIFLISRKDFHDPFHIRNTVPLGIFSEK